MSTYVDFEGITHHFPTHAEVLAQSAGKSILQGDGPAPKATEVPAGTPRRAAAPTDEELLEALMASPDFTTWKP